MKKAMINNENLRGKMGDNYKITSRIESIDCLRGIVAVIMALDHIRSTIYNASYSPTDLTQTNLLIFMTRWITHFCAPVFVFLAGISIYLSLQKGKTKKEMSKHLVSRGIKLILLDIAFVSVVMTASIGNIHLQVLWVLGVSMMILAGLIWIQDKYIMVLALLMIIGHNLLDSINIYHANNSSFIWSILHSPQLFELPMGINLHVVYPLIPWTGIMALGYMFGRLMELKKEKRIKIIMNIGVALTISFVLLRGLNIYGDPNPWSIEKNHIFTILSFLNCEKYPPSLSFLLMTLGPGILVLGLLDKKLPRILKPVMVFGREPLRYYTLHMMMIGIFLGANTLLALILNNGQIPPGDFLHHDLPIVYLGWFFIVVALYPIFVRKEKR